MAVVEVLFAPKSSDRLAAFARGASLPNSFQFCGYPQQILRLRGWPLHGLKTSIFRGPQPVGCALWSTSYLASQAAKNRAVCPPSTPSLTG